MARSVAPDRAPLQAEAAKSTAADGMIAFAGVGDDPSQRRLARPAQKPDAGDGEGRSHFHSKARRELRLARQYGCHRRAVAAFLDFFRIETQVARDGQRRGAVALTTSSEHSGVKLSCDARPLQPQHRLLHLGRLHRADRQNGVVDQAEAKIFVIAKNLVQVLRRLAAEAAIIVEKLIEDDIARPSPAPDDAGQRRGIEFGGDAEISYRRAVVASQRIFLFLLPARRARDQGQGADQRQRLSSGPHALPRLFLFAVFLELEPHRVENREGASEAQPQNPGKIPHRRAPSV